MQRWLCKPLIQQLLCKFGAGSSCCLDRVTLFPLLLQLIEGAEAKAFYGLALNYKPLQALVERLLVKETLSGKEVAETLEGAGVHHFPDPYVEGFLWGEDGGLRYPGMPTKARPPFGTLPCSAPGCDTDVPGHIDATACLSLGVPECIGSTCPRFLG